MPSSKLEKGVNDLATLHPEVAAEADCWDTSSVTSSSGKKMIWQCSKGHSWEASVYNRTNNESGWPYCANKQVLVGFNDLKSKFPDVAAEAEG